MDMESTAQPEDPDQTVPRSMVPCGSPNCFLNRKRVSPRGLNLNRQPLGVSKRTREVDVNEGHANPSVESEPEPKRARRSSADSDSEPEPNSPALGKTTVKKIKDFRLGPPLGESAPVDCMKYFLARKEGTDQFFIVKVLTMKGDDEEKGIYDIQGSTLIHNEFSILNMLKYEDGVPKEHGLFSEMVKEEVTTPEGNVEVKEVRKVYLILDCFSPHDFSPKYSKLINMQRQVLKNKKLPEVQALRIFLKVMKILERLHKRNIVHRDLKLGNIVWNRETDQVTLTNFGLAQLLFDENNPITDQRGSPAYISPEIISGRPYLAKPSDMWGMGVILYSMIYGHLPFFSLKIKEVFEKIRRREFKFDPLMDTNLSPKTVDLLRSLLDLNPSKRPTASEALRTAKEIIDDFDYLMTDKDRGKKDHVVPPPVSLYENDSPRHPKGLKPSCEQDTTFAKLLTDILKDSIFVSERDPETNLTNHWRADGSKTFNITAEGISKIRTLCEQALKQEGATAPWSPFDIDAAATPPPPPSSLSPESTESEWRVLI